MNRITLVTATVSLTALPLLCGCRSKTEPGGTPDTTAERPAAATGEITDGEVVVSPGDTAVPMRPRDDLFNPSPPVVIDWAPAPEFPQKNFRIIDRTMTPRVRETSDSPAVPGAATFTLGWESTGSPPQVNVYRQTWSLGATDTKEFTQGPATKIASLGALADGYHTWTDHTPALNTRNCYYVEAGDGTYWSYSNMACAYSPNPDNPHAVGKVSIRLKLSSAPTAITSSNVRVRLNYGIPGSSSGLVYTWLDANDTPFFTAGGEATFILRTPDIRDLSDITIIRVEVPGDDGLCLNDLELFVDDATAFRKTSATQECGNGNTFDWAWHSGYIDGTAVEIPFEELRNNGTWKAFNPPPIAGTVSESRPDGATFVGYTPSEFRRKIDGITAHNLKENGTDTGSTVRRFRNGNNDVTSIERLNDHEVRVQQHLRLADGGGCTVDAHPTFKLIIRHFDANGDPFTGSSGNIESTRIVSELLNEGIDQNGWCQWIPGVGTYIQLDAMGQFGKEFRAVGATDAGKPPAGMRFCFPGPGAPTPFLGYSDGGLSICDGVN